MFLSKRQLNTSESISIGHCLCGSTSTAFVAHSSWSFEEPHQLDRISPKVLQDLFTAIIIFHLDYCNSVFTGLPADQIARLQQIQNNAARLVMKKRKRDHVTPLLKLKELHWLPVKFRCQYKIATLAYRHFEGSLPPYLSSSLCTYEPSRSLRSSKEKLLKIPKRNLKSFGERSFSFMAPSVWNSLPADLRNLPTLSQFKSNLKTFLFAQASRRSSTPDYRLCI